MPDRKALDDIVFDALGLTEEERKEVYWAVAELVQNRLKKAKSVQVNRNLLLIFVISHDRILTVEVFMNLRW